MLKITETEAKYAKLLVVDRLPAGLEIDNPALFDSGSTEAFDWLKRDIEPVHVEYRDDRFVAAIDREAGQSAFFSLAYVARATTPGHYVYPAATAEDMYRPRALRPHGVRRDRGEGEVKRALAALGRCGARVALALARRRRPLCEVASGRST